MQSRFLDLVGEMPRPSPGESSVLLQMPLQLCSTYRPGKAFQFGNGVAMIAWRIQKCFCQHSGRICSLQDQLGPIRLVAHEMNPPLTDDVQVLHLVLDVENGLAR